VAPRPTLGLALRDALSPRRRERLWVAE